MIRTVVLALALAVPALTLPLTAQEFVQTPSEVPVGGPLAGAAETTHFVSQGVEKTGVEGTPAGVTGTKYAEVHPGQPQETSVTKAQREPASVGQTQQTHEERPVLLPVQPLSVVPVGQVGQIVRPIVVPAEAITAGRIILMAVEPIGQRVFQEVTTVEKPTPYQQPVEYVPVQTQTFGVQPVQVPVQTPHRQTVRPQVVGDPQDQTYKTSQVQGTTYQQPNLEKQGIQSGVVDYEPQQTQTAVPQQQQQTYPIQESVRTVATDEVETPQQTTFGYNPVQIQQAEPDPQQYQPPVTQDYHPIRTQSVEQPVQPVQQQQIYPSHPVVTETVQKQVPQQQPEYSQVQTQSVQPIQQQLPYVAERQTASPTGYSPVQTHPEETVPQQQPYNVPTTVEKHVPQQQSNEYVSVQPQQQVRPPQQPYGVQPVEENVEKQGLYRQPIQQQIVETLQQQIYRVSEPQFQTPVQSVPVGSFVPHVESVQPSVPVQTLSVVPHQQEQPANPTSAVSP